MSAAPHLFSPQVLDSSGRWMDVPVVPGTVLLLVGEFLNFYSNKRFRAAVSELAGNVQQ